MLPPATWCWCCCWLLVPGVVSAAALGETRGPQFDLEPNHRVEFSNSSGGRVDCIASGSPPPRVDWVTGEGSPISVVPGLRLVHRNGSIEFPPFAAERFSHEIHAAVYRCRASNTLGTIVSRDVNIRAVVRQPYEVQVYDEYVISGNTAVLRCQVPTFVADYVMVTSWIQDDHLNIYPTTDSGGKYTVSSSGTLYIYKAGPSDGYKTYNCRTVHRLTSEVQQSATPGRVIVTEPKGNVQPRLAVEKHVTRTAKLGEDVILACVAQGFPVPSYSWFKESSRGSSESLNPVVASDRLIPLSAGLLRLDKIRLDDSGKYVCRVNNSAGAETVHITLLVSAPLSAHVVPGWQVVDANKDATLQCSVSGHPVMKIWWLRDGHSIQPGTRFEIGQAKLTIRTLRKEDAGMYQCMVANEKDMVQAVGELHLGDASPELMSWFTEQTLQPGPLISLKCVASGNPPPQFSWTLDGFPIPDNPRFLVGQYVTVHDDVISHVNVTQLKEEDGGEYTCTAKNSVAAVSHSARINIYGLPFIREMPKVLAVAGTDLVIKCPVAGYPIESIIWERDGAILPANRRQRVFSNGTLVVSNAQQTRDAGTYTCQAQNRQKHTARRDVEVQVLVPPKIQPIQAMTNLLREGMRAAISCQILEGDLPVSFQWELNGRQLPPGGEGSTVTRRNDEYSATLVIDRVSSQHAGNYTCIASNIAGAERFTVPLTVNVPPRWTLEPNDDNAAAGQDLTLHCQAEGFPQPAVSWKKAIDSSNPNDYKEFLYEPNVNIYRNGSLEFLHISKENEGYYLCEAKNDVGSPLSKVVFLKVNAPAHFPQKSKQLQVSKGETAHVQCTALGDSPIEIMWRVRGKRFSEDMDPRYSVREQSLDDGMVSELSINPTYRHDTGVLTCQASNMFGHDEMNIQLIVQESPEMPKNIRVNDQQSRSLQLSWTQPYAGNSPITSYIIQYKLVSDLWPPQPSKVSVPGSQTTAVVQGLMPASSYHLRILAENRLGQSEPSELIQVTTQEEVPGTSPQDIHGTSLSSQELHVSWDAPSRADWNGHLLGYHVGFRLLDSSLSSQTLSSASPVSNGADITSPLPSSLSYSYKTVEVGAQYGGEVTLLGLNKYAQYSIIVQAYNARGAGPASQPLILRTLEDAPSLPPLTVECQPATSQSIQISWLPPPVEGRNGEIRGYKVSVRPIIGADELLDQDWVADRSSETPHDQTKVTESLRTTLSSLHRFTNYSLMVLAFTNAGDGVSSEPIYCRTDEDVPSPPADIKASVSGPNKILVSWIPPMHRNGRITGYTIYMGQIEDGKEEGTHKRILAAGAESHEATRLRESATYQFWVTASTRIGEGTSTRVVTLSPSTKVPARIISFSRRLVTSWKRDVNLPCRRVGLPYPRPAWKLEDRPIESMGKKQITKDGSLILKDVQRNDEGNYTCSVENIDGHDEIVYMLIVQVPPDPPSLEAVSTYIDSIHLQWTDHYDGGSPILGYVINYKREQGDWQELALSARTRSHSLAGLTCGTRYQLYITAYNRIDSGLPCDIVNTFTKGGVPIRPQPSQLLTANATAVTIWTDTWSDGGCSILYFVVEYRELRRPSEWIVVSNHIQPIERSHVVSDLLPATRYSIRITAYNSAGSTVAEYNFTTMTLDGGTIYPAAASPPISANKNVAFISAMKIIAPIGASIVILGILVLAGLYWHRKRLNHRAAQMGESPSVAQMQNQQNRDQQYLAVRVAGGLDTASYKTESADYIEDICPYATFQLSKTSYSESTYSGNVYSGPYHSVRGSFVYHEPKAPPSSAVAAAAAAAAADAYKCRYSKEPEYTKVRRKNGKLRDPHSESQESDNLGSTDSEVKKILTLHLPISEYDSLCTDSEPEAPGAGSTASQELVAFRRRINRVSKSGHEESSSSSENSPSAPGIGVIGPGCVGAGGAGVGIGCRKRMPSRSKASKSSKGQSSSKGQLMGKRHVRSSSGYSSHTEETTFSFSDRIHPPSRFSDSRDLSEPEGEILRSKGRAGPPRLTRETSFQIDV